MILDSDINSQLWNQTYYHFGPLRFTIQPNKESKNQLLFETEYAVIEKDKSNIDGLSRSSNHAKIGLGWIFNKSLTDTTSFVQFGGGYFSVTHNISGITAWNGADADNRYYDSINYDSQGFYLNFETGIRIKNRHKLSFYISPVFYQKPLKAERFPSQTSHQEDIYQHHSIPKHIINGMVGFRYSILFQ
ncbi:MAG: hypothetical protein K0U45_09120 [Alphaproteobacteria bacterium]|nr:hypothetical protein [Alphaproteobacteria bacterium]